MTWAEFQIRLFAYKRMDLYHWQQLRELMWVNYIAPHLDTKKMAKRKETLLPLRGENVKVGVTDAQKEIFLNEYRKWRTQIN